MIVNHPMVHVDQPIIDLLTEAMEQLDAVINDVHNLAENGAEKQDLERIEKNLIAIRQFF